MNFNQARPIVIKNHLKAKLLFIKQQNLGMTFGPVGKPEKTKTAFDSSLFYRVLPFQFHPPFLEKLTSAGLNSENLNF